MIVVIYAVFCLKSFLLWHRNAGCIGSDTYVQWAARAIADLAASPTITRYHVLEALSYRWFFLFDADNG